MEPIEVLMWRRNHKLTQTALAAALGKTRQTVANWETGATRTPKTLRAELGLLATRKAERDAPQLVTPATADHWPHLKLYRPGTKRGLSVRDVEHPGRLVPHLAPADDKPYPAAVLEHGDYQAALTAYRAGQKNKPTGSLWATIAASVGAKVDDA